jgi:arsenate reductase-like glutaredoxin family protein
MMHGSMNVKSETYKEYNIPTKSPQIFIKCLHHSTNTEDIKEELSKLGHCLRNILNAQHRTIKEPLNLFFVDLEPAENNKKI